MTNPTSPPNTVPQSFTTDRVIITRMMVGVCHMQVCAEADCDDIEILAHCNRLNPSGTSAGWGSVIRSGEGAPTTCSAYSNRKHFLVGC